MRATVTLLTAVALSAAALAYEAPIKQSFIKPIPGGKLLLVMLQPEGNGKPDEVRKTFSKSGLYPVEDPKTPLWTCDWTTDHERNVTVSRDGAWAVRVPDVDLGGRTWRMLSEPEKEYPFPPGWQDQPAAFVYHNGKPVRTLAVKDLFDTSRFSGADCFNGTEVTLDPIDSATGRVRLATAHRDGSRQTATVDVKTGGVVDRDTGLGLGFNDCGNTPVEKCGTPPPGGPRWVRVILIGSTVVGLGTAAVVGLAIVLIRRQKV